MIIRRSASHRLPARSLLAAALALGLAVAVPDVRAASGSASLFGDYLAGRFAASQRDNKAAAEFFRDALRKDPQNEVLLERAFVLELAAGNMEGVGDLAQALVKVDRTHRLARLTLGVRALRVRQYAAALRDFSESSGAGPIAEMTRTLMIAWSHQGAGKLDAALKELAGLDGADWMAIYRAYNSALIAEVSGNRKLAGEHYAEAYRLDPSVLRVAEAYARFLARNGRADEAREVVAAYDKVSVGHPHMTAITDALDAGRTPAPIVDGTAAGAAESLYEIGALLAREGGEDHAVVYMQLALHLDPKAALPLLALADIYEQQESYALSTAAYAAIPKSSPLYASAQIQRAHNLNAMDKFDEARAVLEKRIKEDPRDIEAIRALGDMYRGRERFEEGAVTYGRAIALLGAIEERHWTLFYFRGICLERSKQWPKAEADFRKALDLVPDQPFVLNYLGYSWVDQGINLEAAMSMIRKAVQLRPDDGYIVDSLGWAHYRLGNIEDAVRELERAVELKPEDPVINDHLGDAYWRAGRRLEARFQWQHARELKPEPDNLERIIFKLKNGLSAAQTEGTQYAAATAGAAGDEAADQAGKTAAPEDRVVTSDAAVPDGGGKAYRVRPGDTLWDLAQRFYGDGNAFHRILDANQDLLRDADTITPGQTIRIP